MKTFGYISIALSIWSFLLLSNDRSIVEAIINGRRTSPNEFGYTVAFQNSSKHLCGGGIISEWHILTVAHCVIVDEIDFREFPLKIIAGVDDYNDLEAPNRVVVEVEKIYVSDRYNNSYWTVNRSPFDDIAVLKLKRKLNVKNNPGLAILNLPETLNDTHSYENATFKLTGFGYDYLEVRDDGQGDNKEYGNSTGVLHQATILVIDNNVCDELYEPFLVYESQLCAVMVDNNNSTAQGACTGDSGSPLVDGDTIVGLVISTSIGCNDNDAPEVYTKVASHLDFIKNAMNDTIAEGMRASTWTFNED